MRPRELDDLNIALFYFVCDVNLFVKKIKLKKPQDMDYLAGMKDGKTDGAAFIP